MLIVGAKGHAKEILDVLRKNQKIINLVFFDNLSHDLPDKLYDQFSVLKTEEEVRTYFSKIDNSFILGVGGPDVRKKLAENFEGYGGKLTSIISSNALIADYNVELSKGLNIMHQVYISNDVKIGIGSLINTKTSIHHDVVIGDYCEISPGVTITGGARIGNQVSIGTGAIVLPKITIGDNAIVGAGTVVTKSVNANDVVVGNPGKVLRTLFK